MIAVTKVNISDKISFVFMVFMCIFCTAYADFKTDCLKEHNKYRKKHHVPALVLNDEVQDTAQQYADYLASTETFKHSNGKYGENLYMSSGRPAKGKYAVKDWYKEVKNYNFKKPGFSMKTGHFTQVVWKKSRRLGCAYAENGKKVYVVANYDPPGNLIGAFEKNVLSSAKRSFSSMKFLFFNVVFLFALRQFFSL